jgi:glycosyltransferase involved in cell wall biosynthesis
MYVEVPAKQSLVTHFYIVTPSFNSERFIEETLNSVASQKGDFTINYIVCDGGSTDSSIQILRDFEKKAPLLCGCKELSFTWLSEKDEGMYFAINKGFQKLKSSAKSSHDPSRVMMSWINSDDYFFPGAFAAVDSALRSHSDVQWLCGLSNRAAENGFVFDAREVLFFQSDLLSGRCDGIFRPFVQQEGVFWTQKLWENCGSRLDESLALGADFEFWTRLAKYAQLTTLRTNLGAFRFSGSQKTQSLDGDGVVRANLEKYACDVAEAKKRCASEAQLALESDTAERLIWVQPDSGWKKQVIRRDQLEPKLHSRIANFIRTSIVGHH